MLVIALLLLKYSVVVVVVVDAYSFLYYKKHGLSDRARGGLSVCRAVDFMNFMYFHISLYISIYLYISLNVSIFDYIYIYREREREMFLYVLYASVCFLENSMPF